MPNGRMVIPELLDADRKPKVVLPKEPQVGEVTGLAVLGENQGVLLRFEVQTTKGSGRIIPLGLIQRVMRESIQAAIQFIKGHHKDLGITEDWKSKDIAILALMMGIPKEGPSAGITMVTAIVSALRNIQVRHDVAMTGEITIMGKVLGVGGIQAKVQAAIEAGIKQVIVPQENKNELAFLPEYLKDRIETVFVSNIHEVLEAALSPG